MVSQEWKYLKTGNVVHWYDDVYVVAEVKETFLVLIPFSKSRCQTFPSTTWPEDEKIRVHSVKKLANTIEKYITNGIKSKLFPDLF